jgi:hypothetical protein
VVVGVAVLLLGSLLWLRRAPERALPPPPEPALALVPAPAPPPAPEPPAPGPVTHGRVFLQNGLVAPYAALCVFVPGGPLIAFAAEDGSFEFPIEPAGLRGVDLLVDHPRSGTPRNAFVLHDRFEVQMLSMKVSGRAVDLDGRPVPFATVDILPEPPPRDGPWLLICPSPQADREGRFELNVQRRRVRVVCRLPGLLPAAVNVDGTVHADVGDLVLRPLPPAPSPPLTANVR